MDAAAIYRQIEDKWYALLDSLSDKGVPVYNIIDPIENAGIPSLPLVAGVLIIVAALAAYVLMGAGLGTGIVTVTVTSAETPLEGATVAAFGLEAMTGSDGVAELELPAGEEIKVEASSADCESQSEFIVPPGEIEFDLLCRVTPQFAGCSTISEEYSTATVVGEGNTPLVDCSVVALDGGDPIEIDWGIDGNTMFLDDSVCLQDDYQIQVSCLGHQRTLFIDELRNEMIERGEVTISKRGAGGDIIGQGDCDADGIPDSRDKDNDNDGIFDVDDLDVDGDGINNAQDADTCGQDTRKDEFIPPGDDPVPPGGNSSEPETDVTYSTYVTVRADTGEALDGITITAVDSGDVLLETGYDNTIVEDRTQNGTATLVLPSGQNYYVKAEDSMDVYRPTKSGLMIQTRQQELSLVLQRGFPTTITVVGEKPVAYATVRVMGDPIIEKKTDFQGRATLVLDKGELYDAQIIHEDYIPLETSVTGGVDSQIVLEKLDDSNSGTIRATALNAKGIEEGFAQVRIDLVTESGMVYKTCTTPSSGMCEFRKVLAGDYRLRATPPGAIGYQESEKITLAAGATVERKLLVAPAEVELRVLTKVNHNPAKDVKVTLYDISYGVPEKLDSGKSGENRRVKFTTYRGKKVYVEAEYHGDMGDFGPTTTSPFTLNSDRDMEIDLSQITRTVSFTPPEAGELSAGKLYTAKLVIELPYADEKTRENYDKAVAEIWVGDPGDKSNPIQTPVVLGSIDTYVFDKQQRPRVTVAASDAYTYGQDSVYGSPGTSSKYLRFTITDYEPTVYEIEIPLFARGEASGEVTVRYRASWTDSERRIFTSHGGDWAEATLNVLGAGEDKAGWFPATGDFSSYNRFLSTSPEIEGEEQAEKKEELGLPFFPIDQEEIQVEEDGVPMFTTGSTAFLHVRAIAARESDSYVVKIDSFPPMSAGEKHMLPLAYRGVIKKADGKVRTIYSEELDGSLPATISPAKQEKDYYALDVDDELHLVVSMRPNGSADAEIAVLNDLENTLHYRVKDISQGFEETVIPNVEARMRVLTTLCPSPPYTGSCAEGEMPAGGTMPSYDLFRAEGREFKIKVGLRNAEATAKEVLLRAEGTGIEGLDYPDKVELPANGIREAVITGTGASANGGGINVYLWAEGLEEQVWKTVPHAAISYEFGLVAMGAGGAELNALSTHAKEIQVVVLRKSFEEPKGEVIGDGFDTNGHADAIRLSKSGEEYWAARALGFRNKTVYTTLPAGLDFDWGFLKVQASHPEFGWLERSYEVHGTLIEPVTANNSVVLDDDTPSKAVTYTVVTNNWDEVLELTLDEELDNDPQGQNYGLDSGVKIFDAQGFELVGEDSDIPARGRAELWISAKPPGTGCNLAPSVNKIEVEAEPKTSDALDTGTYSIMFSCAFEGGPEARQQFRATKTFRESIRASKITPDSCASYNDIAYICDAEQFSMAVIRAAEELKQSDNLQLVRKFALADDVVTPVVMSEARMAHGSRYISDVVHKAAFAKDGSLVISQEQIGCGVVTILFEKGLGEKITANIDMDAGWGWCGQSPNVFLGMMNYDEGLRDEARTFLIVKYAGFTQDSDLNKFTSTVYKYVPKEHLFGNFDPEEVVGESEAPHVVSYREFTASEYAELTDPKHKWLKPEYESTGFFNIDSYGDVQMGIVYEREDNLERHRECMLSNLALYWTLGDSGSLRLTGNSQQVFDLDKCVQAGGLEIPKISMKLHSLTPYELGAKATGDPTISVEIEVEGEVATCHVWNYDGERGSQSPATYGAPYGKDFYPWKDENTLMVYEWNLNQESDGMYTVKAACVSPDGLWSTRESMQIILDRNAPVITIEKMDRATTEETVKATFTVTDKYEVAECKIIGECPPELHESTCSVGIPVDDPLLGNKYTVTCDTPPLALNEDIMDRCEPTATGHNRLNITCTDVHGNTAGKEKTVFRMSTAEIGIQYSCESYRDPPVTELERMKTLDGPTPDAKCDQDKGEVHGFMEMGGYFIVNTDNLVIPISVSAENPLTGCSISNSMGVSVSCGPPTKSISDYKKFYNCPTISPSGDRVITREGRNTGIQIQCAEIGVPVMMSRALDPIVLDTTPPVTTYVGLSQATGDERKVKAPQNLRTNFVGVDSNGKAVGDYASTAKVYTGIGKGGEGGCASVAWEAGFEVNDFDNVANIRLSDEELAGYGIDASAFERFTKVGISVKDKTVKLDEEYHSMVQLDTKALETGKKRWRYFASTSFTEEDQDEGGYSVCYYAEDRVGNKEDVNRDGEFNSALGCKTLGYGECVGGEYKHCMYTYVAYDNMQDCHDEVCEGFWKGAFIAIGAAALAALIVISLVALNVITVGLTTPLTIVGVAGVIGIVVLGLGGMGLGHIACDAAEIDMGIGVAAPSGYDVVIDGCFASWDLLNDYEDYGEWLNEDECRAASRDSGYFADGISFDFVSCESNWDYWYEWREGTKTCETQSDTEVDAVPIV